MLFDWLALPPLLSLLLSVLTAIGTEACQHTACSLPQGHILIMMQSRMMMPAIMSRRIFMSFHHICLRTRCAPRRKPCADTDRLSSTR